MDYRKLREEQSKKAELARIQKKAQEFRTLQLRPRIDKHDLDIKIKQMRYIISKGNSVKLVLLPPTEEHPSDRMKQIFNELKDVCNLDTTDYIEGFLRPKRTITMTKK